MDNCWTHPTQKDPIACRKQRLMKKMANYSPLEDSEEQENRTEEDEEKKQRGERIKTKGAARRWM